ncbi:MAG: hypothetical protein WA993_13470 [Candidatus Binatus sp.]|uniref:hypothetical protein n=1 Tax=Candidatus Binatus sp. TaxID=2811406 RepID=UPI003CB54EA3
MRSIILMALAIAAAGCGSGVAQKCWGDPMGDNFCTEFVQQHLWTGGVAITVAKYPVPGPVSGLQISGEVSTSTGIASSVGGSIAGEAAQHVVVVP